MWPPLLPPLLPLFLSPRRCSRLTAAAFLALAASTLHAKTELVAGPVIGHVGPTSARIWLQLNTTERVSVRCYNVRGNEVSAVTADVEGPAPFIFDGPVSGLQPARTYRVEILFDDKPSKIPDLTVQTAPAAGDPAAWTLAFGSGINPETNKQMPIFTAVDSLKPRAFLFLGNTGSLPDKLDQYPRTRRQSARFFNSFQEKVRNLPDLQRLFVHTANYAVWGEHDFGITNASRDFAFAKESWAAFTRYWPNPDYGAPEAPGLFHNFTVGDVEVFMLDTRMYRDPDADAERKTLLGDVQLAWLRKGLKDSTAAFKIIAAPSAFLTPAAPGVDAWANYPAERDEFIAWLFKSKITGVVFLSGSRRFGEMTVRKPDEKDTAQYPLYELTSSPLAADLAPPDDLQRPNPGRIGVALSELNFGAVEFGGPKSKRHATLRLHDAKGAVKLDRTIFVDDLQGQ